MMYRFFHESLDRGTHYREAQRLPGQRCIQREPRIYCFSMDTISFLQSIVHLYSVHVAYFFTWERLISPMCFATDIEIAYSQNLEKWLLFPVFLLVLSSLIMDTTFLFSPLCPFTSSINVSLSLRLAISLDAYELHPTFCISTLSVCCSRQSGKTLIFSC